MNTAPTDLTVADEREKARAALRRSMSLTRMLDYGMDHWDATHLFHAPADEPWHDVAAALADEQLRRARSAEQAGNRMTAAACHRRATAVLIFAQMAFNSDTAEKRSLYRRLTDAYQAAADVDDDLHVERLAVPFGGSACTAWLVTARPAVPTPAVVIVGGQSGWGPAYHRQAEALARRGLTAVLLEAPGQGLTRIDGGLHLDATVDRAFSATLDLLERRTGQAGPHGVWGNSLGGLFAARAAVSDDRFAACCVNGATTNPGLLPFRTAREQSLALLGFTTDEPAAEVFRTLWLDPTRDRMRAALLVLHGGADPLITQDQQEAFLPLSSDSSMRVWPDGEHTIYNHSAERTELVADWFRAHLVGR